MAVPSINAFVACQACHSDKESTNIGIVMRENGPSTPVKEQEVGFFRGMYDCITGSSSSVTSMKTNVGSGEGLASITFRVRNFSGDVEAPESTTK